MNPFWHWSIGYHSTDLSLGYMDSSPSVHITPPSPPRSYFSVAEPYSMMYESVPDLISLENVTSSFSSISEIELTWSRAVSCTVSGWGS